MIDDDDDDDDDEEDDEDDDDEDDEDDDDVHDGLSNLNIRCVLLCLDEVAAQLQAVMKPNSRKARPSCKKGAKKSPERPDPETEVWEVSDGEVTASRGPNGQSVYVGALDIYNLIFNMVTTELR